MKLSKGFTLLELLVVISIIGFLAAIVIASLGSARSKGRNAKRVADVRQIMTALELYYNDNNGYPAATGTGQAAKPDPSAGSPTFSTYLVTYPTYPTPIDNPTSSTACNDNTGYAYSQLSSGSDYSITFCIGGTVGTLAAGDHTAKPSGMQ